MSNNNNKRKLDGRRNNKRMVRTKIMKSDSLPPAKITPAKKNRAKQLSNKAIKNIFGSEDGIWDALAEQAMSGNMKAMEMLLQYQYGKAGEQRQQTQTTSKAPIIQFVNPLGAPQVDDTIDITHEEDEDE